MSHAFSSQKGTACRAPTALFCGSRLTVHGSRLEVRRLNGSTERGITLIELLVAMAIVALMVSISYPTMTRGLDGIRLKTAVDRAGTFFNAARQGGRPPPAACAVHR